MATNWLALTEKENAKAYVLPKGWDSRDDVAAQLDCSPEKVDDHLRPALKSGKVTKQQFRVWDSRLKRTVMTIAYSEESAVSPVSADDLLPKMQALKKAGKTYAEIGDAVGLSRSTVEHKLRKSPSR